MVGIQNLVNRWIDGVHDMPDDDRPTDNFIPTATIPEPDVTKPPPFHIGGPAAENFPRGESDAERDARIFGEAAVRTASLRRTIEAEAERNTLLTEELQETLRLLASERKKSGFLELENAELRNNLQTSEADRLAFVETQQRILQAIDRHGVKRPVAKRNGKPKDAAPEVPNEQ